MQMNSLTDTQAAVQAMLACALWTSSDDGERMLDADYVVADIAIPDRSRLVTDLCVFAVANAADLADMDPAQVGHDFWLTRNHHGAGFWDRGMGEAGDRLTAAAEAWGEASLYIGDDGRLYAA
jgi:hypothetical protein